MKERGARAKRLGRLVLAAMLLGAMLVFVYSFLTIYRGVRGMCGRAQAVYHEDCVDALGKYILDDQQTFKDRNMAIWALGQLADERALPALRQLETGERSDKELLDEVISQYEVNKAIRWSERGNATSWMYRNQDRW